MIGVDNFVGPELALDDVDLERLLRALDRGAKVSDVALVFGLSKRTVYRYRYARLETVDVAGWPLTFLVFRKRPPSLVSRRGASKVRP
jgi:hypothetical protein